MFCYLTTGYLIGLIGWLEPGDQVLNTNSNIKMTLFSTFTSTVVSYFVTKNVLSAGSHGAQEPGENVFKNITAPK